VSVTLAAWQNCQIRTLTLAKRDSERDLSLSISLSVDEVEFQTITNEI